MRDHGTTTPSPHPAPAATAGRALILLMLSALLGETACGALPARQSANQEALQGCRAQADRVYDAQNRYQLSERDSRDSPNSGSGSSGDPSAGLSDQYSHARMVDDCLSHSAAVPVSGR